METTGLDEIKNIESQTRKVQLIEILQVLKEKARAIKSNKFYTDSILKEMQYSEKDIKAIIDYINSQVSVDEESEKKSIKETLEK